ncbi:MAG TPA: galactokinase [Bacteroidales bacterium]|nr:galactokinase [Bacteroidales bacterium]
MDINSFTDRFLEKYGDRNNKPALFFSPGRVNLIGEHTDYNGGYVFPCALNYGTYLAVRKTNGNTLKFSTLNFNEDTEREIKGLFTNEGKTWVNYPLGVINEFLKKNIRISGLELLYFGDVPNGAGLSSSASIEMVTAVAINELFNGNVDMLEMVKMSQRAENQFVGMNCGIMDQFAVGFGKRNHAIFLNCDNLSYENVPLVLNGYSLIITNTNKRRGLTDSKYNERRSECDRAVELLQKYKPIRNLSELSTDEIPVLGKFITDEVVRRRATHVISENGRVLEAVSVLKENNIVRFGELMNQSHDSLKDDYEVTGTELDTLVYEGRKLKGVIGTRMTGAGFGGCTVSIVRKEDTEAFITNLKAVYTKKTGLTPDFYLPEVGDGAKRIG